jgi:Ca-activated chloride channel family protein
MTRFTAARASILATLDLLPDDAVVGLRLYGSVSQAARMSCTDTVLAVPFATARRNRETMKAVLANTHARGVTPIAFTLEAAAADFTETSFNRTIILVSDGGETCGGSPCTTAATLAKAGFVINTVGFFADAAGKRQLQCIATASGGTFFNTPTAVQLPDQLAKAMGICPIALGPMLGVRRESIG